MSGAGTGNSSALCIGGRAGAGGNLATTEEWTIPSPLTNLTITD